MYTSLKTEYNINRWEALGVVQRQNTLGINRINFFTYTTSVNAVGLYSA